jgi:GNAT superfamily N-acetyltransferase
MATPLCIEPFQPADQDAARTLILDGLREHWGRIDPALNPDLRDIAASYAGGVFLVARAHGGIVGTGAWLPRAPGVGEVVRMSVAADVRRQGVATRLLAELCRTAQAASLQRLILETNADWTGAIAFYQRRGFQLTHYAESVFGCEAHFEMELTGHRWTQITADNSG